MSSESNPTLPSSPATFRSQHYATNNISAAARAPTAPQGTNATGAAPDTGNEKGSNVQVVVRCRPQSEAEKRTSEPIVITNSSQSATITVQRQLKGKPDTKMFTFDQTYGQFSTQNEVYENAVKPLVDEVMAGFNCTVFAYGQTGTGKTYTMEGELTSDIHSKHAGVIPRSIHTIFEHLEKSGCESSVKVSFLEIYNEELSDLLTDQPTGFPHQQQDESKQLRIFEDTTGKKGTLVNNLEEILVTKAEEVFQLLQKSSQRRRTAETLLNKNSSRSHSVFTITVHTKETSDDGEDIIRTGKLHLVDLAGSECIGRSGAQNQRAKEAGKINQSLLTLGRVINALVEKAGYIPYRDSKLTRLLQESLGGRAKTVIIATVSPSMVCVDESMSTLDYAHRAKNIRNRPQVNQKMTRKAYMKELLMEIASLKRENEALRTKNGIYLPPEKYDALIADGRGKGAQLEELMFTLKAKEQELKELSDAFDMKEQELTDTKEAKQVVETKLEETEGVLQTTRTELKSTQDTLEQTQHVLTETVNTLTITQTHLEETQHLVEKHVETEKELTSQAQTLTSTLETVIIDKNALHDKINRKTIVEKHNDDVAIVLQQQVQTHVHEMGMMSDKMMEGQMANNAMLEGTIKQMQKQHGQQCADLNANLTSWDASLTQHTSSLRTLHASHHDTTQQMVNIQHDTQHKHSTAQMNACSALQQQHTSHISTLQNEMKSQSERVNTWANVERDAWNIQVNNVKQHVSQQQHAISTLSSTINEHHTQHSSTLTSQHDYLTTFIQQQTQQQQELQTSFISQVTSLFTSLLQQQQASMTKAVNEMQTVITQQQQVIQQQYQALQKQTTEMTSAVTTYGDDTVTTCNSNMTTSDASHTEITSQHDNITRHIDAISSHLNNTINDVVNVEKQHLITVDTAKDTLITSLSQQHDAVNVAIEKLQTDATLATQQHTSAVTAMASTVDTASTSCHTIIGEQVASIHTYQHANTDSLQSLHLRMDTYITSDRHSDKRTMTTPEKREFSYPHELVATREHDEILQEYRQQQAVAEKEHDAVQEIQSVDKNVTPLVVEPVNVVAAAETNTSIPLSFPTASSVESISPKSDISDTTMKSKIPTHVKKSSTSSLENEGIDKSSKSTKLAAGVEKSKLPQPKTRTRAPFAATNQ